MVQDVHVSFGRNPKCNSTNVTFEANTFIWKSNIQFNLKSNKNGEKLIKPVISYRCVCNNWLVRFLDSFYFPLWMLTWELLKENKIMTFQWSKQLFICQNVKPRSYYLFPTVLWQPILFFQKRCFSMLNRNETLEQNFWSFIFMDLLSFFKNSYS